MLLRNLLTIQNLIRRISLLALFIAAGQAHAAMTVSATVTNVSGPVRYTSGIAYNGSINAIATGGTAPYAYSINPSYVLNNGYFPELPAGTYTVVATDATGQQASTTVTIVNLYPQPSVSISGIVQPSACNSADGAFTLTGTGGTPPYTYSVDRGTSFTANNVFTNLNQGIYEVLIMDANSQVAQLGVNPTSGYIDGPFVFLAGPECDIGNLGSPEFTASCTNSGSVAITIYSYTAADSFSLDGTHYRQIPSTPQLNVYDYDSIGLAPGLYHFYLKEDATVSVAVGVCEKFCYVNITFISIDASCGQSDGGFQVTATNGYPPYSYSLDGINFQASNTFTGLSAGNYNVIVKDLTGSTYAATATVFNKCPTVTAFTTNDICGQNNGTITATGNKGTLPYQFSIDGTHFQSGNVFTGLTAGNYIVTIKDALGYTSTAAVAIDLYCLSVTAIATNTECGKPDGTITTTASGGQTPYSYSTDGINFQPSVAFTGLSAGNYLVTTKDATGSTATTSITIIDLSGPSMTVATQPATCDSIGGGIAIHGVGGSTPYQYSIDGVSYQSLNSFSLPAGGYTAWLTDAGGCSVSLAVTIPLTNNITLDLGLPSFACQGASLTVTGASNATGFLWSPASGLDNPTIPNPTVTIDTSITYVCTATWGTCQKQAIIGVTVNPAPTAKAGPDTTICYGQSVQVNGTGGDSYHWSPATDLSNPNVSNPIIESPEQTITYQLTVADPNGCTSLVPASLTVHVTPPAKLSAGDDTSVLVNTPIQLSAIDVNNIGFTTYTWAPATGLSSPDVADPVANLQTTTNYTITATTSAGCQATASLTVKVYRTIDLIVPSAFTPNSDGHNDLLRVILFGMKRLRYFAIFNRWGQRIFYSTDASVGWDGTMDGRAQSPGVYIWMAAAVDINNRLVERQGSVVLVR